ncbi:hypothetical protein [Limibacterium fermenti]|uniref:hypothetical protein n=1 Tax=Limibacterium fermenti TaxID=3229863 RepID=UPI000E87F12D|nr:hypothetical protein [Porphyromonadaceae bacterium]HBX47235.1 hypothetical protein [Porphyromonadaceae bacterium]
MKKLISLTAIFCMLAATVSAQQIEKIFEKYQEDERFQYIYQKKENKYDRYDDYGDSSNEKIYSSMVSDGRKMLTLNTKDKSFAEIFKKEINQALEADKFENTSYVRTGKDNKVAKYYRITNKRADKVTLILNSDTVMVIWSAYIPKNEKK